MIAAHQRHDEAEGRALHQTRAHIPAFQKIDRVLQVSGRVEIKPGNADQPPPHDADGIARADQVELQTGNFALYPRYSNPGPRGGTPAIAGWTGSAELTVQGKDIAAIAQLTGRVQTMTIARVGYTLSREAREKVEADAVAQAISRWRAKAQHMSQQFGYTGYSVREVNVATNEPGGGPVPVMMRAKVMSAVAEEALPTEAGKGEVTATVSGSAQMTK